MRGISQLEFVVVIVVIGILSGLLLVRVLPLIGQAERIAYLKTRQQLQSALLLEAAERVARGESASLIELDGSNPIELLLDPPGNYLGTGTANDASSMPRRSWRFAEDEKLLVYRPGRQARFVAREGPEDRIELRVNFVYRDRDADGAFNASVDHFDGLRLESIHDYAWAD